ncbi:entericidin EcnA/B family protein [Sphingomonas sp. GCM10030256]
MVRKCVALALIGSSLVLAACNTVRGAARDINSAANCTENTMNGGRC